MAERIVDDDEGGGKREETKRLARALRVGSLLTSQPYAWTRAGLATELEVCERSIDRDLELWRGLGYEIKRDRIKGYAFVHAPPLPPVQLSLQEVLALTLAAELARESGAIDTSSLGAAISRSTASKRPRCSARARPSPRRSAWPSTVARGGASCAARRARRSRSHCWSIKRRGVGCRKKGALSRSTSSARPAATSARLTAGVTPEMVRWILGYGPHCRVLSPDELREQVRAIAQEVVNLHDN